LQNPKLITMKPEEVESLCAKINSRDLSDKDAELLIGLVNGSVWVYQKLEEGKLTIRRLQKLFGVTTERSKNYKAKLNPASTDTDDSNSTVKNHGRLPESAYTGAEDVDIPHPELIPGELCPEEACGGKLYEIKDSPTVIRIEGQPIASAKRYHLQSLRCALCQTIFTAPLPEGVHPKEKYDARFKSLLLINKYFTAVPFYRQEALQDFLGIPMPASTQWDVVKSTVPILKPVYAALLQELANSKGFYVDDTHAKILEQLKANKRATKKKDKKSCYTTGILGVNEQYDIYLFITNTQTAGGCFDGVWGFRNPDLPTPFFICDGLAANIPKEVNESLYLLCHCLSHARRKFYDLQGSYEELAEKVLGLIGKVYAHDAYIKKKELGDEERFNYHKEHSLPLMDELKSYLEYYRTNHLAEPNGSAGEAIRYMLDRWEQLTRFTQYPGIPLDTNILEQALKMPIRNRKNALFYKTAFGAEVAGMAQSLIFTAAQNDINPYEYLTALIEHEQEVSINPKAWLPWNYKEQLSPKELATLCQESVSCAGAP
jgi:transposase